MAGREQPQIPDPMQTSRDQLALNRFSQATPWGNQTWMGNTLQTTLNPADQQRLGMQRQFQSGLLSAALGGQGAAGGAGGGSKPSGQGVQMPAMDQGAAGAAAPQPVFRPNTR